MTEDHTAVEGSRAPVIVVTGPTASGKSGLALAIAEAFDGTVINADSMQVYRELEILTARPDAEALARAPHRLYGVIPGAESCSAGRWRALALKEIDAALEKDRLPIVVGGTGLYLKALAEGLAALPSISAEVRERARARHALLGGAAFHAELALRDPATAARLHAADSQRLIRAWEVLEATGRSLTDWQAETEAAPASYRFASFVLLPPRPALYAACDRRFEAMLAAGALDEVRALLALDLDPALPVMKALGVAELADHLRGTLSLEAAVDKAQQATRRYAKRQVTWLRTQGSPGAPGAAREAEAGLAAVAASRQASTNPAPCVLQSQYSESFNPKIFNKIREFELTLPG